MFCFAVYNQQQHILHRFWGPLLDFWELEKAIITRKKKSGFAKILEKKEQKIKTTTEHFITFHFLGTDEKKKDIIDVTIEMNIPKSNFSKLEIGDKLALNYVPNSQTGVVAIELDMNFDE